MTEELEQKAIQHLSESLKKSEVSDLVLKSLDEMEKKSFLAGISWVLEQQENAKPKDLEENSPALLGLNDSNTITN